MAPDVRLIDLGVAVADRAAVDWDRCASADPSERAIIQQLRLIEGIARVHAGSPARSSGSASEAVADGSGAPPGELTSWGPLTIAGPIGRGTFGDVYRARDPRLDRPVALKLLRHRESHNDARESAVIDEAG